ncbi:MAG: ABC transporter permease [Bifidobacteriaceae bacterium]|jgi:ABC-2 type transport system permease protein|nr:ABC transporter permease [Bifidobacteriaceae bacterium]
MTAFLYAFKATLRNKGTTLWAIAMPLALASLFYVAFGNLDASYRPSPVPLAVVDDSAYRDAPGLAAAIDAVSSGAEPWLAPTYVATATEAARLVDDGGLYGYIAADADTGALQYHRDWREYLGADPGHEVVAAILDAYTQNAAVAAEMAAGPVELGAGASTQVAEAADVSERLARLRAAMEEAPAFTKAVQLTANPPSNQVRYFYSALGFSVLMGCSFAVAGVARLKPNRSILGARLSVGGKSRLALVAPTVGAALVLAYGTLVIAYLYMRFALGVDFGGKDFQILAVLGAGAVAATALGTAIGALPLPEGVLSGVVTTVACVSSLFAGLYGPGSQHLAEDLARAAPWTVPLNPAREIYDALFSLYCYDTFDHAARIMAQLAVLALALFALAPLGLRRVRHDHL